jgi:hypothetical protein
MGLRKSTYVLNKQIDLNKLLEHKLIPAVSTALILGQTAAS